jgi:folate-dependent phosphoribosylglycinamide formyltransferase PurN
MSKVTEAVLSGFSTQPNVALFMSGLGTNAQSILSDETLNQLFNFASIVTDNEFSRAQHLGSEYNVEVIERPVDRFDDDVSRKDYFKNLSKELQKRKITAAIYAGFMKISTGDFCKEFPGINIHPADLTIVGESGIAKYRGMGALTSMIQDLGFVRSTVHVVDTPVDSGKVLALTEKIYPLPGETPEEVHTRLKSKENIVYVETLKLLGRGVLDITTPRTINGQEENQHV